MPTPLPSSGEARLTVQRSKFYAQAFPAASTDEVERQVKAWKTKYRRARHTCWACRVPGPDGAVIEQARDDGEVGHPGRVLLNLLQREDLLGGLVVARIFGGVKLGTGGVSRAFRDAALAALDEAMQR
ncbi:MAG TPA: YigZ family protein [Acidobacteria bacterium]|nr:YigZ family protein [Acidobacteriota bacterium]